MQRFIFVFFFSLFYPHFAVIVSLINTAGWLVLSFGSLFVCLVFSRSNGYFKAPSKTETSQNYLVSFYQARNTYK